MKYAGGWRRVQGRHPLQTSDALGAAGVQLGPNVAALHTESGLPLEETARVLGTRFGLHVTKGGLVQLLRRTAGAAAPAYAALCEQIRRSPVVTPDETGWRVDATRHWLMLRAPNRSRPSPRPAAAGLTAGAGTTHPLPPGGHVAHGHDRYPRKPRPQQNPGPLSAISTPGRPRTARAGSSGL